ncbi:hypothetical protein BGZ99_003731 [Dissophora globulifera]|uniref:Uncharacterized protein n=1 Tax=Dissophora globulifera TaxID=979702 RepID=A0A9P6UVM7_9FUNG|nr:hypothetical protein BGZ99_003731 [Dissophora globulifera]
MPVSTIVLDGSALNSNNNNSSNTKNSNRTEESDADKFQTSGGYIYVVLATTVILVMIYFIRAWIVRRRERRRLSKEPDCEVPPGYYNHIHDMPIYDDYLTEEYMNATQDPQLLVSAIVTIPTIQPPPLALTRTPSPEPPAYEELLSSFKIHRFHNPSSISLVSDTTSASTSSTLSSSTSSSSGSSGRRSAHHPGRIREN